MQDEDVGGDLADAGGQALEVVSVEGVAPPVDVERAYAHGHLQC